MILHSPLSILHSHFSKVLMACPFCGKTIHYDMTVCPNCGRELPLKE